jgi:uncharacterized protein (DUF1697 family)
MPRYAAFLRGVNLGRNRRVSGAELGALFEELGFEEVASFRSSGNVAFSARREPAAALTTRVEKGVAAGLGFETAIFLRDESQMRALAGRRPFEAGQVERSKGKLQVILLAAKPGARAKREALALATDNDLLAFGEHGERELFWLPSGGIRDSKLDLKGAESLLGPTTMRTMGTIEQMTAKFFAD